MGRYSYANQIKIGQWNLARFAETLIQFFDNDEDIATKKAKEVIDFFSETCSNKWLKMMNAKLGLFGSFLGDDQLVYDLLEWMHINKLDYTNTFLDLSDLEKPSGCLYQDKKFEEWYLRWQKRLKKNLKPLKSSISLMKSVNPTVIPRNHIVELTLEAAYRSDFKPLLDLLDVVKKPYSESLLNSSYQKPPDPSSSIYQTFCGT